MPYHQLTGHPKDGGVLMKTDQLEKSRRMDRVHAFSLTERMRVTTSEGVADALTSLLTARSPVAVPNPSRGGAHALASHLTNWTTIDGASHARALRLGHPRHA